MGAGLVVLAAAAAVAAPEVLRDKATTYATRSHRATVTAATHAEWRARRGPPQAGCAAFRVGDAHLEIGNTDEVFVEHCGAFPPRPPNGTATVAVCVPVVYGDFLNTVRGLRWTARFLDHYRALAVSRFVVYTATDVPGLFLGDDVALVHVAWLAECAAPSDRKRHGARCDFAANRSIMYWGQNFVLNDCLQRAAAEGFDWTLNVDLDELLTFAPPVRDVVAFLEERPSADVVSLGSAVEAPVPCAAQSREAPCVSRPPAQPTCAKCADCALCLRNHGRRKHLSRTRRVAKANVHFVQASACLGETPCAIDDTPTHTAWLRHFSRPSRRTLLFEGRADWCPRCAAR